MSQRTEVPHFHHPWQNLGERLGRLTHDAHVWTSRHWKRLSLSVAALGAIGYIIHEVGPQQPPVKPTTPASDTLNFPGSGSAILIPGIASPTPELPPLPKPSPTLAAATPEASPTKAATTEATATATNSPTVKPAEAQPTPTAVATPEAAKVVYWTEAQILQAQKEAAKNNQTLLLDTWSQNGIKLEKAKTYNKEKDIFVLNGFSKHEAFNSPVEGKVVSISVLSGRGIKARLIEVNSHGLIIKFYLNLEDNIFVKEGDYLNLGAQISEFTSDNPLPSELGFSRAGQIAIVCESSLSDKNILKNKDGEIVYFPKKIVAIPLV